MADHEYERREGPHWKLWVALVAVILFVIFIAQNSTEYEIEFLFATVTTPLFFALLIAGLLGAVIGWLAPRVWRGRRD